MPLVVKSISMDEAFYRKIARHAKKRHMSASGWLAAAAEEKLEKETALTARGDDPRYRATTEAIIITDPDGRVTRISRAFTEMCGYTLREIRGKKPGEVLQGPATEKDVVRNFRKAIKAVKPFTCTMTNYDKQKTVYRAYIQMRPLFEGPRHVGFEATEKRLD